MQGNMNQASNKANTQGKEDEDENRGKDEAEESNKHSSFDGISTLSLLALDAPVAKSHHASQDSLASKLRCAISPPSFVLTASQEQTKRTSFREEVATRIIQNKQLFDDGVFETDEDEIDESAIDDDDDCSDWEDSNEESGNSSIDEKTFFKRVDS